MALLGPNRAWVSSGPNDRMPKYDALRDPHLRMHHTADPVRRHLRRMNKIEVEEGRKPGAEAKLAWRMVVHEMYATPQRARRHAPGRRRADTGSARGRQKAGSARSPHSRSAGSAPRVAGNADSLPPIRQGRQATTGDASSSSRSGSSGSRSSRSSVSRSSRASSRTRSSGRVESPSPARRGSARSSRSGRSGGSGRSSASRRSSGSRRSSVAGSRPGSDGGDAAKEEQPAAEPAEGGAKPAEADGGGDGGDGGSDDYNDGDDGDDGDDDAYDDSFDQFDASATASPLGATGTASPGKSEAASPAVASASGMPEERLAEWVQRVRDAAKPDLGFKALSKPCKVREELYLGGEKAAKNVGALSTAGVTQVINCAPSQCKQVGAKTFEDSGIKYTEIQADDDPAYPLLERHLEQVVDTVSATKAAGGSTLVHCFQGVNRSATLVIASIMCTQRVNLLDAVREAHSARPIILQGNDGFVQQLVRYAEKEGLLGEEEQVE